MLKAGKNPPSDIYAFIEVPQDSLIKYELDKETNTLFVDRFLFTSMVYPFNYGFIPQTKADDGDPLDILVISRYGVVPGSVLRCRPIGALEMSDESGYDVKILAVVHSKLDPNFDNIKDISDLPQSTLDRIKHFFEHYKSIEPGKWVKVDSFKGVEFALDVIKKAIVE